MKGMRKFKEAGESHLPLVTVGCEIGIEIIPKASFSAYLSLIENTARSRRAFASQCSPTRHPMSLYSNLIWSSKTVIVFDNVFAEAATES